MKKFFMMALLSAAVLVSCGKKTEDKKEDTAPKTEANSTDNDSKKVDNQSPPPADCNATNAISIFVKDYQFQTKKPISLDIANFEVKESWGKALSDTELEFTLANYPKAEDKATLAGSQVKIVIKLVAKNGKKIMPGSYLYQEYEKDLHCIANIYTAEGKIWFNWVANMPKQGSVDIDAIAPGALCGKFNLAVDKPGNKTIGTVKLNGTFKTSIQ